jgi:hypothetical protein
MRSQDPRERPPIELEDSSENSENSENCWLPRAGPLQKDDKLLKTRDDLLPHLAASLCAE